jgi:hypothetical protein
VDVELADAGQRGGQRALRPLPRVHEGGWRVGRQRLTHDAVEALGAGDEEPELDLALAEPFERRGSVEQLLRRLKLGDRSCAVARFRQPHPFGAEHARRCQVFGRCGLGVCGQRGDEDAEAQRQGTDPRVS